MKSQHLGTIKSTESNLKRRVINIRDCPALKLNLNMWHTKYITCKDQKDTVQGTTPWLGYKRANEQQKRAE